MTKHNYCFVFVSSGFDETHSNIKTRGIGKLNGFVGIRTSSGFTDIINHFNKRRLLWKKS